MNFKQFFPLDNKNSEICDTLYLFLNSAPLQKFTENYLVNNIKILNAVVKPLPAREGLLETFKSFKNKK